MAASPAGAETKPALRVSFGPDYRHLVAYQQLLADALAAESVTVDFLSGYRRLLPIYRALRENPPDVFHLHFPVHYIMRNHKWDRFRKYRFFADLHLAARCAPLVYTVHDLYPTDFEQEAVDKAGMHFLLRRSAGLILHSDEALRQVLALGGVASEKCAVIPHGDLTVPMGPPVPRAKARAQLGLGPDEKICLALGIIAANKGLDELIAHWKFEQPEAVLYIAGNALDPAYGQKLNMLASGAPNIRLRFGFLSDYEVKLFFSAADCVVLNYRKIFTSGVASLARSFGVPILLPARLTTVYLHEPHPSVFRYDSLDGNFGELLEEATTRGLDYASAADWRAETAWPAIASKTRAVYDAATAVNTRS